MAEYLVIHEVKELPQSQEEWIRSFRGLRARCNEQANWLSTSYEPETGRIYCVWKAESPEDIKRCFLPEQLEMAPVIHIGEIIQIDPKWLAN